MKDQFILTLNRIREGKEQAIDATLSSTLLDIYESDLQFNSPITLKGKAYLANNYLILDLSIRVEGMMPCSICNQLTSFLIDLPHFIDNLEFSKIKENVYNCTPNLREGILLEVPNYVECKGNCPKRAEINKYLIQKDSNQDKDRFPFADLKTT